MPRVLPLWLCILILPGCAATSAKRNLLASEFADGPLARSLDADIHTIERSEPQGWRSLALHASQVDGEYAETFAVACANLVRRDPTVFLRRHLAGDADALLCGWAAFGWDPDYRPVLDAVYRFRLLEARSATERQRIQEFIDRCHDLNHKPTRPKHALQTNRSMRR